MELLQTLFLLFTAVVAAPAPQAESTSPATSTGLASAASTISATTASASAVATGSVCSGNTADDRSVWCDYSIDTDYYTDVPNTGVTVEYWFDVTNVTLAPDGYERVVLAINGSTPGPTIEANWGDFVVIHVTNNLQNNGSGIHWHGLRQNYTNQHDGVPSVTQCPIAPGDTLTYKWRATQYGTSWYHSHFSLQAWEGVAGPIVIHGPATANYDEELGTILISDWSHDTADSLYSYAETNGPPPLDTGLINGKNSINGSGSFYEATVEAGKSYRIRLVNVAIDSYMKFTVDNHNFTVIANDFVPIVPYTTDIVTLTMGQRYDLILNANQGSGDFWIRAVPQAACSNNDDATNIRAILRYDSSSTADPTTTAYDGAGDDGTCDDEPYENLVPYLSQTVSAPTGQDLAVAVGTNSENLFRWQIGLDSMQVYWDEPTLMSVYEGNASFKDAECVYELPDENVWVYWAIETTFPVPHPIHLHGHDFFVLAQADSATYDSSVTLNLDNPPRRDVVNLPASGYVVIAFLTDNPGVWLMHCHIGWHTSMGLALQFLEREAEIPALVDGDLGNATCNAWDTYFAASGIVEEDSGV